MEMAREQLRLSPRGEAKHRIIKQATSDLFGEGFEEMREPVTEMTYGGLEKLVSSVFEQLKQREVLITIHGEDLENKFKRAQESTLTLMGPNIFGGEALAHGDRYALREYIEPDDVTNVVDSALDYSANEELLRKEEE